MSSRTQGGVAEATPPARPEPPEAAGVAESHCAVVLFVADRAYKVKKPVDFGFLDFSSVAARETACRREVELNRRLAPDVYLDLFQVLDGSGRARDWVVVMRRMPVALRLSTLVSDRVDVRPDLKQLARILASFHSAASRGPEIDRSGEAGALRGRWADNIAGAKPFAGGVLDSAELDEITRLAMRYVDGRVRLFDERIRRGCVVDGHGDLQAEDVFCLPDGPRVLDCLEFDDALRYVDGIDDAAFLAMDLERLGAPELGTEFLDWYREFSGVQAADSLAHHYIGYRAFVRAKVACLRHDQGDAAAADVARRLTDITLAHLRAGQVRMLLVGGLPGTGKSTIADELADQMGAVVLRTDQIRRELAGSVRRSAHEGYGRGLYASGRVHDTYREMLARARTLVEHGESVVLDASWNSADERVAAREIAAKTMTSCLELRCVAPPEITTTRISSRVDSMSDATTGIAARMAEDFADWPEAVAIDTSGEVSHAVSQAWDAVTA